MYYKEKFKIIVLIVVLQMLCGNAIAGSLYNEKQYRSLVGDNSSHRVGDILTVLIFETATASNSADSDSSKSTDVGLSANDGHNTISGNVGLSNGFNGKASNSQSGKLAASVSVSIEEILPNDIYKVSGVQFIELNNDMQKITVTGLVRKDDISTENSVLSTRLAKADIKFVGEGLLASRTKPGIITSFFNWLF